MGRKSKQKGKLGERQAATLLMGVRTWEHLHDIFAAGRWWEVKWYASGFTKLYDALEEHALHYRESGDGEVPVVAIRQDHKEWIVVFYADDWLKGLCNADPSGEPTE